MSSRPFLPPHCDLVPPLTEEFDRSTNLMDRMIVRVGPAASNHRPTIPLPPTDHNDDDGYRIPPNGLILNTAVPALHIYIYMHAYRL